MAEGPSRLYARESAGAGEAAKRARYRRMGASVESHPALRGNPCAARRGKLYERVIDVSQQRHLLLLRGRVQCGRLRAGPSAQHLRIHPSGAPRTESSACCVSGSAPSARPHAMLMQGYSQVPARSSARPARTRRRRARARATQATPAAHRHRHRHRHRSRHCHQR